MSEQLAGARGDGTKTANREAARRRGHVGVAQKVLIATFLLIAALAMLDQQLFAQRIFPGMRVGPVGVGWLGERAAAHKLQSLLSRKRSITIVWAGSTKRVEIDGRDFGIDAGAAAQSTYEAGRVGDILVRFEARLRALADGYSTGVELHPRGSVRSVLRQARSILARPAVNARFVIANGKVRLEPSKRGWAFDDRAGALELADALLSGSPSVRFGVVAVDPKTTTVQAVGASRQAAKWARGPAYVHVSDRSVSLSPAQVLDAARIHDGKLEVDPMALRTQLGDAVRGGRAKPTDARFRVASNKVYIVGGRVGRVVDLDATARSLTRTLDSGNRRVVAVMRPIQPLVTRSDLAALGIKKLLSSFTTRFRLGQDGRDANISRSARAVNGTVLEPGEIFSLNKTTGPRNRSTGYKEALVFSQGKVVPGIGGGVCQVSSTLYEAALLANLHITKRNSHSMAVSYLPPGRDATTFYPTVDLKFQNNRTGAILLWSKVRGNALTVQVYGSGSRPKVTVETIVRKTVPPKRQVVYSSSLRPGQRSVDVVGRPGYIVASYRLVWQGKRLVQREFLANDKYRPKNWIIRVGR